MLADNSFKRVFLRSLKGSLRQSLSERRVLSVWLCLIQYWLVGHLNGFFTPRGGNLNKPIFKSSNTRGGGRGCCTFELIGALMFCCHWDRISNTDMCLYGLVSNAAVVTKVNNTILIFKFPFFFSLQRLQRSQRLWQIYYPTHPSHCKQGIRFLCQDNVWQVGTVIIDIVFQMRVSNICVKGWVRTRLENSWFSLVLFRGLVR